MANAAALLIAPRTLLPNMGPVARAAENVRELSVAIDYRVQLEHLIDELSVLADRRSRADVARYLDEWFRHRDVRGVIDATPGGSERVLKQALREYSLFVPTPASNASDPISLLRIILLQQLDLAWWAATSDFADNRSIASSPEVVDLRSLRAAGGVRFGFGIASDRLVKRARDYVVQRALPAREPRGPGLPFHHARPEIVAVLNELAGKVALLAPPRTPPIWVNSIVRSVRHQSRLRDLGFTALLPSAHCRGWAADVEMSWFDRFAASGALREVLLDYQASGVLNVIDEGRAWHLCLAPHAVSRYSAGISVYRTPGL